MLRIMRTDMTLADEPRRFPFGENWRSFLDSVDENRIAEAEASLKNLLDVERLQGKRFVDVGSGSGLFSLAARRLGAEVHSFDYDIESVRCTSELKQRYFPTDSAWVVEQGSALDEAYLTPLGTFDVVYSWGVLHHTGSMWRAMDLVHRLVRPGGSLALAIYNDAGGSSTRWRMLKRIYNALPRALRGPFAVGAAAPRELRQFASAVMRLHPKEYLDSWTTYAHKKRGMSKWHDIIDWVGGHPYEFAKPDRIFSFFQARGFSLRRLKCSDGPLGCNEFVFVRNGSPAQARAGEGDADS